MDTCFITRSLLVCEKRVSRFGSDCMVAEYTNTFHARKSEVHETSGLKSKRAAVIRALVITQQTRIRAVWTRASIQHLGTDGCK